MSNSRIFLADDHEIFREGVRMLINEQPDMEVVGEAGSGRLAWQRVTKLLPDVVLMDISMPNMDGVEVTKRLSQECPSVRVIVLTAHEDKANLRELVKAGASGYVLKRAASKDLIQAIHVVAAGRMFVDPTLAGEVMDRFYGGARESRAAPCGDLSRREAEVLRLIALGHSNKEIAAHVDISVKTVETYKTRLMGKLDLHSRAEIVRYALRQGWLQDP